MLPVPFCLGIGGSSYEREIMKRAFFAIIMLVGTSSFAADLPYRLIPLGDLPGDGYYSRALDLNDHGQVVGQSNGNEAFIWDALNGMRGLGDLPGGSFDSGATSINNLGQIAGMGTTEYVTPGGTLDVWQAWIWDSINGMVGLGDLPGGRWESEGGDINDHGQIVGDSSSEFSDPYSRSEAFIWDKVNGMIGLGDLPGGMFASVAVAINDDGYVAGRSHTGGLRENAFLWHEDTGMVDLGFEMDVADMNDLREIVGSTYVGGSRVTAIWDSANGLRIIPASVGITSVGLMSINDLTQAVGAADYPDPPGGYRSEAIMWDEEHGVRKLIDLCDESADGWILMQANAINILGQIAGMGRNPDGHWEAYLLIPEPATLGLLLVGAGLFAYRRRMGR